ncbi:MAG: zf-HC2 domain-containing protein [Bacteroidetes bacterium]|nr:zf-HC2 domain-containing protein [Bacteroidota bacterium]
MKCKEVHKNLIFYIENELNAETQSKIQEHINGCVSCKKLYEKIKNTLGIINKEEKNKAYPFFFTRIQQKIEELNSSEIKTGFLPSFTKALKPVTLAILIAFGIFFGINLGNKYETNNYTESNENLLQAYANEYYVNELNEETIETFLLND